MCGLILTFYACVIFKIRALDPVLKKIKFMLAYLRWKTLTDKHSKINLHVQVPYHGKSFVDAGFAYMKKLYRRYEINSLDQLASVDRKSAASNEVVVFGRGGSDGEWLDWKTFSSNYFVFYGH